MSNRAALGWNDICAERLNRLALVKEQHADACRVTNEQKARELDDDVAALRKGAAALSAAPAEHEDARAAVEAGWDDGVRFAAEVLRSQVYPRDAARRACVNRVLATLRVEGEGEGGHDG